MCYRMMPRSGRTTPSRQVCWTTFRMQLLRLRTSLRWATISITLDSPYTGRAGKVRTMQIALPDIYSSGGLWIEMACATPRRWLGVRWHFYRKRWSERLMWSVAWALADLGNWCHGLSHDLWCRWYPPTSVLMAQAYKDRTLPKEIDVTLRG